MTLNEVQLNQVDELLLIRSSILPDELFQLITPSWEALLDAHSSGDPLPLPFPSEPPRFRVGSRVVWFDVTLSDGDSQVVISVGGDGVGRDEGEKWNIIIGEKREEINQTVDDFPTYQLFSAHLLPMTQSLAQSSKDNAVSNFKGSDVESQPQDTARYHAFLSSHHLISPEKRRSLSSWSRSLRLSGFAKVGYPGVIYVEGGPGSKANIEEFVKRVKGMQWLALKVRFVEEVKVGLTVEGWKEVEKVGEVVEEMRKRGREKHVVELGLGSSKSADTKEK